MKLNHAFLAAALVALGATAAQAADYKIKTAYTPRAAQAPLYVAEAKGFFTEEKLNVELVVNNSASTVVLPMLARGDIDVLFGGPSAALFNAMNEGLGLVMVADGGRADPSFNGYAYNLIVRKDLYDDGKFKSLADLKGKVVSFGVQGGTLDYMMYKALKTAGLQPSDVTIRYFASAPDMGVALTNKGIDAAAMIVPTNVPLARAGITVDWKDVRELAPDMQMSILVYGENFISQHRQEAMQYTRAYVKAVRWIKQAIAGNDTELVGIVSKYTQLKPEEVHQAPWIFYDSDGRMNVKDITDQYQSYVARNISKPGLDMNKHVDEKLRADAVAGLK